MPITYSLDPKRQIIIARWRGEITASELTRHCQALFDDHAAMQCRRSLADIREATIAFSGEELRILVTKVIRPVLDGRRWTTALLVGSPVHLGVIRQYEVFAASYSHSRLFEDEQEALTWLAAQPIV